MGLLRLFTVGVVRSFYARIRAHAKHDLLHATVIVCATVTELRRWFARAEHYIMLDYLPILASVAWALSALAVWGWVVGPFLVQRMEAPFLIQLLLAATLCAFLVWIRKSRRDKEPIPQSQASSVSPPPSGGTCAVCQTKRDDTLTLSCGSHSVSARCLDALRTRAFVELPEPDACPICRAHLLAQQAFMRAVV